MSDILVWGDVESFGLNERTDHLIEVGFQITDLDLNTLDLNSWLIWGSRHEDRLDEMKNNPDDQYVLNMHTENGLFDDARNHGISIELVQEQIIDWFKQSKIVPNREPFCGSSVRYDRRFLGHQMPEVDEYFHYRIIDSSTLKELCRRYNKRVYENIPPKAEQHRVEPDLVDTIEEFKFYRDEFLTW